MDANWTGVIIAFGVFLLGLLGNVVSTIWWASKITTTLSILTSTVNDIKSIIAKHEATYYTKEEAVREFAHVKQQTDALWKKVDILSTK